MDKNVSVCQWLRAKSRLPLANEDLDLRRSGRLRHSAVRQKYIHPIDGAAGRVQHASFTVLSANYIRKEFDRETA